jgi:hypothetical protein
MRKQIKAALLAVVASIVGCAGYFMAEYNPAVDSGATALQQKVDHFLAELEQTSGAPEGEYERHAKVYGELRSDIAALRDLAESRRGNALTLQSLDLIEDNVRKLEAMHTDGISPDEIRIVRTLFDSQFRMLVQLENAKRKEI